MELTSEPVAGTMSILDSDPSQGGCLQWAQLSIGSHSSPPHQMPECLLCALTSLENSHPSGLCGTKCQKRKGTALVGVKRPISFFYCLNLLYDFGQISSPLWFSSFNIIKELNRMIS